MLAYKAHKSKNLVDTNCSIPDLITKINGSPAIPYQLRRAVLNATKNLSHPPLIYDKIDEFHAKVSELNLALQSGICVKNLRDEVQLSWQNLELCIEKSIQNQKN